MRRQNLERNLFHRQIADYRRLFHTTKRSSHPGTLSSAIDRN